MMYDVRESHPVLNARYEGRQAVALKALRDHEAGLSEHPALVTAVNAWLADHHARRIGDVARDTAAALRAGDIDFVPYQHIIVDEFQDLTATEAEVLVALLAPGGSFVGLGDRKQSIYAFRGNDARGLDALPGLVRGDVVDWTMNECQRCCEEVVVLGNAVMALEDEPLVSVREGHAEVIDVFFDQPGDEIRRIAREIVRVHRAAPEDRVLVLVTRRFWGHELRNAIRAIDAEMDVETSFAEDVLETWHARQAFMLLEAVGDPDPVSLRAWVGYKSPGSADDFLAPSRNAPAYMRLKGAHGVLTTELVATLSAEPLTSFSGSGRAHVRGRLARLQELLDEFEGLEGTRAAIEAIFDADRWVREDDANAELAREDVGRLYDEALALLEETPELDLSRLVNQLRYRIATREPLGRRGDAAVQIVTLWGAKGLTADFVFVAGLVDQALPGRYDASKTHLSEGEWLAEQRRLFYVSLTRAKKALVMSRPQHITRAASLTLGLRMDSGRWDQRLARTRFLRDLPAPAVPEATPGADWAGVTL